MKTLEQAIIERFNMLLESKLNTKEDIKQAVALWKNLPQAKKASEAKKIIKASKDLGYPLKQQEILSYGDNDSIENVIKVNKKPKNNVIDKINQQVETIAYDVEDFDIDVDVNEMQKNYYKYRLLGGERDKVKEKDKDFAEEMNKPKNVDYFNKFSSLFDSQYYAVMIIRQIQDQINNDEFEGDTYQIVKDYWISHDLHPSYNRSRVFDSTLKLVNNWSKSKI